MDDEYAALVDSVPGFGGWFVDTDGIPVAVLVDTGQRVNAAARLAPRIQRARRTSRPDGSEVGSTLRIHKGNFDFRQLRTWADMAEDVLDREPAAVYVDANEVANLVEIGVSEQSAATRVSQLLRERGVPSAAIKVNVVSPARDFIDITQRLRPIPGGVLVYSTASVGGCTHGFNASLTASGPIGFFTAAHCTTIFGSPNSPSEFWQPAIPTGDVGVEILDPSPWQTQWDCPAYRAGNPSGVCRYSDAAFIDYRYLSPDSVDFGYIARTTFKGALLQPGSRTINGSNKHFEIASKYYQIPPGVYLDRMGQRSGWTYHNVSSACATVYGTNKKMWCQHKTGGSNENTQQGDSGAPLWSYDYCDNGQLTRPDGTQCIRLAGMFWGVVVENGYPRSIFSQVGNIELEFGTFGVRPADKP